MNLNRIKDWSDGDTLTAGDLEAEFDNIYDHNIGSSDLASLSTVPFGSSLQFQSGSTTYMQISNSGQFSLYY